MKSSNPVMNEEAYKKASPDVLDSEIVGAGQTGRMTVNGAINKTLILMGLMLITTVIGYTMVGTFGSLLMWGGAIGGLIVVLIASFKPHLSPTLAPIYALLEGLFVGAISAVYASVFDGIIFQAVSLTLAVLFMMLFIYKSRIIKVTSKFRAGVVMATGAIFLVYIVAIVLSFFGINMPYLHESSPLGIGISFVIIGVAALNLLLDFDNFEKGEQLGAPSYMEWFSAMGLLITLVWLYIEILRLIAMFSSSD
ncbi:MAG: Bax inhibitor-1/YccA family protein [Bacteroidota bacterium]